MSGFQNIRSPRPSGLLDAWTYMGADSDSDG